MQLAIYFKITPQLAYDGFWIWSSSQIAGCFLWFLCLYFLQDWRYIVCTHIHLLYNKHSEILEFCPWYHRLMFIDHASIATLRVSFSMRKLSSIHQCIVASADPDKHNQQSLSCDPGKQPKNIKKSIQNLMATVAAAMTFLSLWPRMLRHSYLQLHATHPSYRLQLKRSLGSPSWG